MLHQYQLKAESHKRCRHRVDSIDGVRHSKEFLQRYYSRDSIFFIKYYFSLKGIIKGKYMVHYRSVV